MSAKNIPPTLDKIDKIACKACRRAPYALKKKTKTTKGIVVGIVEVCVATSYIYWLL